MKNPYRLPATLACAAFFLAACQSLPGEQMDEARAMVTRAGAAAVGRVPSPELARSEQKVLLAQRWIDAKDYGPARWLAEQAAVDAELALARYASQQARLALAARERTGVARISWKQP